MNTNKALYDVPQVKNFKELIENSVKLYGNEPAFKLRNSDGSLYDINYISFKEDIYALGAAITDLGWLGKQVAIMGKFTVVVDVSVLIGLGCR